MCGLFISRKNCVCYKGCFYYQYIHTIYFYYEIIAEIKSSVQRNTFFIKRSSLFSDFIVYIYTKIEFLFCQNEIVFVVNNCAKIISSLCEAKWKKFKLILFYQNKK